MKTKVLVIEDEEVVRSFYRTAFGVKGFDVVFADDGDVGLEMADAENPDLIVLDIMMPTMHGFEVCRRLRGNTKFEKTPIIITSAKSYKADIDKGLELGADAYLVKPFTFDKLLQVCNEQLTKRKGTTL